MILTYDELSAMAAAIDRHAGWNPSQIHIERAPVPWTYDHVVPRYLSHRDTVLDVGTGNGRRFLSIARHVAKGIGIDIVPELVEEAHANKLAEHVAHVTFQVMDAHNLALNNHQFDVILNRQADIDIAETVRVLRPSGLFITQQVGRRNLANLLEAFSWLPDDLEAAWMRPIVDRSEAFRAAGCRVVAQGEYDVRCWFKDVASLLLWLQKAPLPQPFNLERDWPRINRILRHHTTPRGIESNEHREILIVQKL